MESFGRVLGTPRSKGFYRPQNYQRERDCYFRLQEVEVTEICGLAVPRLVAYDDELMMVEMGIVSPPRVLDFGKAYLDRPPDYPPELLEDSMEEFRTNYAEDDWETVLEVVDVLRSIGIHYYDLRPGNIQVRRTT